MTLLCYIFEFSDEKSNAISILLMEKLPLYNSRILWDASILLPPLKVIVSAELAIFVFKLDYDCGR